MDKYLVTAKEIEDFDGLDKAHFLNPNGRRRNKSLGDLTGLTRIGVHLIEVQPGHDSTEPHVHYHEEECVYVLSGQATATIGEETFLVGPGDFIGYRAGGLAHKLTNTGQDLLRCLVMGQRLAHDVADYPDKGKRLFRNEGMAWNLTDLSQISEITAGQKK